MQYRVRRQHLGQTAQLDALAREAGRLYSQTVVTFWRIVRKQGLWLTPAAMMRLVNAGQLHAHTIDATVQAFYASLKSWRARRKSDPAAHPPRRRRKFFRVEYKASAIRRRDGQLYLSNGKGRRPLILAWPHPVPRTLTIRWMGTQYEALAVYEQLPCGEPRGDQTAGVDLGEIHMAVSYDGQQTYILNGRYLRSVRQYQNKLKAKLAAKIAGRQRGSRRHKQLLRTKRKQLLRLKHQIRDIEHKQTSRLVSTLHASGVQTLAIGDVRDIRQGLDYGHRANQRLHQWSAGKTRFYLTYKAARLGMRVALVDEHRTTRTCPACGHVKQSKVRSRNYACRACGAQFHRDGAGAMNIRARYLACGPVVGRMARPVGIHYRRSS